MKIELRNRWKLVSTVLFLSAALHSATVSAQTNYYYENPNDGQWDLTDPYWATPTPTSALGDWANGVTNIANIDNDGASARTLTLATNITAQQLNLYATTVTSGDSSNTVTYTIAGTNNLILANGLINQDYSTGNQAGLIDTTIDANVIAGSSGSANLTVDAIGTPGSTKPAAFGDTTLDLAGTNTFKDLHIGGSVKPAGGTLNSSFNTVFIDNVNGFASTSNVSFDGTDSAFGVNGSSASPITITTNNIVINNPSAYSLNMFVVGIGATTGNTLQVNGVISGNGDLQFSAGFSGDAGLGTGTVILNNNSSYVGQTRFNAGIQISTTATTQATVQLGINNALPTGTDLIMSYTAGNGGIFDLHGFNQTVGSISTTVSGSPSYITNMGSQLSTLTISGSDTPANPFSDAINDDFAPIALVRAGTGTTVLANSGSSYSGGTQILGGTLSISADGDLGATGGFFSPQNSVVINGGTLAATSSFTLASNRNLALGPAAPGTGTGMINVSSGQTLEYDGAISDYGASNVGSGGTGGLTLTGPGTLTLGGSNSYSGPTVINAGTLNLSQFGSLSSSSAVTIGTSGKLAGSGTANGSVTVNGAIAPGSSSAVGTLTVGSLTLSGGGSYIWKVADQGGSPGTGTDFISIMNALTLNNTSGSPFTIDAIAAPSGSNFNNTVSNSWVIATAGSAIPTFNSNIFAVSSLLGEPGSSFTVSGSGDNLLLSYNPGPIQFYVWKKPSGGSGSWDTSSPNWSTSATTVTWPNTTTSGAEFTAGSGTVTLSTPITAGILLFNVGGYTIAGTPTLSANAITVTNSTDTDTISAPLSATSLLKSGSGTLVLTNASNSLSGTTTLGAGTLQGNAASLQSNISVGSGTTLVFDQSTTGNFSGNLTGSGALIKQNTGDLTLSGTNSGFSGAVSLIGGTLSIASDGYNSSDLATPALALLGTSNSILINGGTLQSTASFISPRLINVGTSTSSSPTATIDVNGQTLSLNGDSAAPQAEMTLNNGGTVTIINSGSTSGSPGLNIWGSSAGNAFFTGTTGTVIGFTPTTSTPGNVIVNGTNLTVGNTNDIGTHAIGNSGELVQFAFGPSGVAGSNVTLENGASLTIATSISLTSTNSLASIASLNVIGSGTITDYRANMAASSTSINVTSTATTLNSPMTLNGTLTLLPGGETSTTSPRLTVGAMTLLGNSTIQTSANITTPVGNTGVAMNFAQSGILDDNGYATTFYGQLTNVTASTGPTGVEINGTGFNVSAYYETGLWTIGNAAGTQGISVSPGNGSAGDITTGNIIINPFGQLSVFKAQNTGFPGQTIYLNGTGSTTVSGALVGDGVSASTTTISSTIALGTETYLNAAGTATISGDAIDAVSGTILILNGSLTGAGTMMKQGAGTLDIYGTYNTATGNTSIGNGTLNVGDGSSFLAATIGTANLTLSQTGTTNDIVNFNNTAQSIGFLASGFAATSGTQTNTLNLNGNGTVGTILSINQLTASTFGNNGSAATLTSTIAGKGSIVLLPTSTGTLTFNGSNTYTGGTTIDGGTLKLDFSAAYAPSSNILAPTGGLTMGGGTLSVNGKASPSSSQTVAGLAVIAGASAITDTSNGSASALAFTSGTISRGAGGTLDFTLPALGNISFSSSPSLTGGILGGWATVGGGASFATVTGGNVAAYSGATSISTASTLSSNTNYDVAASLSASGAANSLRFTNTATPATLTLSGIVPITTGGILVPTTVATTDSITGGTIEGSSGGDLVVTQNNSALFTIGSTIVDNTSATALTKSGSGAMAVMGTNTYSGGTYINAGILQVGSGSSSGTLGSGAIADRGALSLDRSDTGLSIGSVISGSGALNQIGGGTSTLTAANPLSGITTISSGTLRLGNTNALQNSTVSIGATNGLAFNSGIGTFTIGGLSGASNESLQDGASAAVTLQAGNNNASTSYSGVLSGNGGLTKVGTGTLTLSGANLYSGASAVNGGTLKLDFTAAGAPTANILPSGSALNLGGGSLLVNGAATGGSSQTVASLTVNPGASTVVNTANSSMPSALTITSSTITRNVGGTVDFTPPSGTQSSTNGIATSASNTSNILGGWATVTGTDWATNNGGTIGALSSYTADTWAAGNNTTVTQDDTPSSGSTTNSLRFASTTTGNLVTLSGTNAITSGGILISSAVTAATTVTGGTIEGSASGDLIINQNSISNFTLSSVIADNGGPTALTKSGAGTLVLGTGTSTNNTFTGNLYINQGSVLLNQGLFLGSIPSGNVLAGGNIVYFGSNAAGTAPALDMNGLNLSVGGLVSSGPALFEGNSPGFASATMLTITGSGTYNYAGTFIDGATALYLTINGSGTQILSGTDSWSGPTVINSGALQIGAGGATGALGSATVTDNTLLTFDLSSSPTVANLIQGNGQLDQIGSGTTTLTNASNSYIGQTFVSGGTLATTSGGVMGSGPLVLTAASGVSAAVSLGTSQSVASITNTTAAGGTTRIGVASGITLTSSGVLTNTGTLNINTLGQSGGNVVLSSAPTLNANSGIVVNAGMLEFNLPSSDPATIGSGASVTVAAPAIFELAGSSSALSNSSGSVAANVNNSGSTASGGGFLVYGSHETVAAISGTAGTDANGATIYTGDTTVGSISSASNLTATQILQNSLTVAANSTVTIVPSSTGGSVVTAATAVVTSDATSTDTSSSDSFEPIQTALGAGSTLHDTVLALKEVVLSNPGMKLSGADEVALYNDYQASIGNGSGGNNPPSLASDLTSDGLSSAEINTLTSDGGFGIGSLGIGSLSPAVNIGGSAAAVPEPSSLILAGMALIAISLITLKRRTFSRTAGSSIG